jgi:hypothetical protein
VWVPVSYFLITHYLVLPGEAKEYTLTRFSNRG